MLYNKTLGIFLQVPTKQPIFCFLLSWKNKYHTIYGVKKPHWHIWSILFFIDAKINKIIIFVLWDGTNEKYDELTRNFDLWILLNCTLKGTQAHSLKIQSHKTTTSPKEINSDLLQQHIRFRVVLVQNDKVFLLKKIVSFMSLQ